VKTEYTQTYIVETKGREEVNDLNKIRRLVNWCKDVNRAQDEREFHPVYIKQEEWEKHKRNLRHFSDVKALFLTENSQ
jgi:type III restriction enzyme